MNEILSVKNLEITFHADTNRKHIVVQNMNLSVEKGQMTALVGASGCGKTITALAVAGLLPDTAQITGGSITVCGHDVLALKKRERRKLGGSAISMIFQEPASSLNPLVPVGRQIAEPLRVHRHFSEKQAYPFVIEAMERAGLPECEKLYSFFPHQLSGGLCQRVMIALALICKPALLIADEPTTALDACIRYGILEQLKSACRETNTSVLFISHDLETIAGLCEKVAVMNNGSIAETNSVREIFIHPRHECTKALVLSVPKQEKKIPFCPSGETILEVRDVCRHYGKPAKTALNGVSFSLRKGEIAGIVGESGCGKTTLARCIANLDTAYTGTIRCCGSAPQNREKNTRRKTAGTIQMIFQNPAQALNPRRTVLQILKEPLYTHRLGTSAERRAKALDMLRLMELEPEYADRYPHELSGGQKQRIAIGSALMLSPDILIADEAVSALDPPVQAQILKLLARLNKTLGISILFISHNLSVVHSFCDTITVMCRGKIVEQGNADDIYFSPQHSYTKHLLAAGKNMLLGKYD